ncbi:MAG TPA: hypothetical protein VES69_03115 [Pyrinomonadaceae bacterium]|nr:hypothetical protein [Pyrinomonadaceae bacterium]
MRSPKRIAVLLIAGFFAFAPPGTLIFGFMIILGVVGNVWLAAGGALGLVVIGLTWLMIRRRAGKGTNAEKMPSRAEP